MIYKKLKDEAEIIGGQIVSRIALNERNSGEVIEKRKVLIPKCILSDGTISMEELPTESLIEKADDKKLTRCGDIVIKLSTPYDSAIITEKEEGILVPSFCAIIRNFKMDINYLQAFLSSSFCKEQLKMQVAGATIGILSVGKIGVIDVLDATFEEQKEIGLKYRKTQNTLAIIKQIAELEGKRNDIIFKELSKRYGC